MRCAVLHGTLENLTCGSIRFTRSKYTKASDKNTWGAAVVLVIDAELLPRARPPYAVGGFLVVFKTLDWIVPGTFIGLHA